MVDTVEGLGLRDPAHVQSLGDTSRGRHVSQCLFDLLAPLFSNPIMTSPSCSPSRNAALGGRAGMRDTAYDAPDHIETKAC